MRNSEPKTIGRARALRKRMTDVEVILWSKLRCHTHSTDAELEHDRRRDHYLHALGWRVLHITSEDVYKRLDVVMDAIARELPSG